MNQVERTHLRALRGARLLGVVLAVGFVLIVHREAEAFQLPPGAVLTLPPGAVVVPAPLGVRAMRQAVDRDSTNAATPTVSIQVIAPAMSPPGKKLTYRIVAENTSDAAAHHVLVKVTVSRSAKVDRATPKAEITSPEGAPDEKATLITWKLETLRPRAKREQTFVVTPANDDEITCYARVQFEHGQRVQTKIGKSDLSPVAPPPPAPPIEAPPAMPRPGASEPPIEKERQPSASAALQLHQIPPVSTLLPPNEAFHYEYEVKNIGTATAKDVVLEATPAVGLNAYSTKPSTNEEKVPVTWKLDEIAPGATRKVEYSIAGDKLGTHVNKAVVKAAGGLREEVEHTIRIGQSKLVVLVTGPAQRGRLREAIYHIAVRNVGNAPALDVELSDEPIEDEKVSDAVTRVRASAGGKIAGNIVRWPLRNLAVGEKQTVRVVLQAKDAGEFTYRCTARAKGGIVEQGSTKTRFVEPGELEIELDRVTDATTLKVGAEVSYSLRLRNGKSKENTNVDVIVTIPNGLELIELKAPTSSRPKGPEVHLPRMARLVAGNDTAILRFKALEAGVAKITVKAASDLTGPDKAARLEEVVTVEK